MIYVQQAVQLLYLYHIALKNYSSTIALNIMHTDAKKKVKRRFLQLRANFRNSPIVRNFQWFENVPSPLDSVLRGPMSRWMQSATRFKSLVFETVKGQTGLKPMGKTINLLLKRINLGFGWWYDHTNLCMEAHTSSMFFLLYDWEH